MSTVTEVMMRLQRPFPVTAIHWRCGATTQDKTKGIALAYIDARDVMNRLDDVVGPFWQCRYTATSPAVCEIGLNIDGEWLWRANGAGHTDVEGEKGALSDAFKRAAVLWGIGRYLYALPNEWCDLEPAGRSYRIKSPPKLPAWATDSAWVANDCHIANTESIAAIKDSIATGRLDVAAEAWHELGREAQVALWVAPTTMADCGLPIIFTTQERETMKTTEFREAHSGEAI